MKLLPAALLFLLSSNADIVFGNNIRRGGSEQEKENQQSTRTLAIKENDNNNGGQGPNLFGGSSEPGNEGNGSGKKDDDFPVDIPVGPSPSTEEDEEDPLPAEDYDPIADAKATATALGLSFKDAQELLEQQKDFAELVDSLQDDGNFLQGEMPSEPNGEYVIKYKNGNIPPQRQEAIKKFKAKNENAKVASVSTKLSMKDAKGRGERLSDKLNRKGYSHVSFSIDGDGIEVIAKKSPNDDKKDKGRIPTARAAEILDLPAGDDDMEEFSLILMEHDDEDPADPFHTYGGRKISGSGSQCTTAFSVISSSGATGIATAAHCTGMNWYDAIYPESDYSTYFQGQHRGIFGDVEWHQTSHLELPEYYATPTTRWPVRSIATSISKGQVVCGYSRMQGTRKCDTVHRTSVSVKYSGLPRMYNLVAMKGRMMVPGDSGGPWSYYDKAFGVVSGYMTICDNSFLWIEWNCHRRDIWSRASYLGLALGVQVRTQ